MEPYWIENGRIAYPSSVEVETPDGTVLIDGWLEAPIGSPPWNEHALTAEGVPTTPEAQELVENLLRGGPR